MQLRSLRFFLLDLLNLNRKICLKAAFDIVLSVNDKQKTTSHIWERVLERSLLLNKLIGFEMHEILFHSENAKGEQILIMSYLDQALTPQLS
jgi:hypothetical protein